MLKRCRYFDFPQQFNLDFLVERMFKNIVMLVTILISLSKALVIDKRMDQTSDELGEDFQDPSADLNTRHGYTKYIRCQRILYLKSNNTVNNKKHTSS